MHQTTELHYGLPATRDFVWAVVDQRFNGVSHLVPVRIGSRDDSERAFQRIKTRLACGKPGSYINWVFGALFLRQVASTATIRYVCLREKFYHGIMLIEQGDQKRRGPSAQSSIKGLSRGPAF